MITGVGRGIGLGLARRYLSSGNRVFGTVRDLSAPGVKELTSSFGEHFTPVVCDVREESSVSKAAASIAEQTEALDLLINNAGVAPEEAGAEIADIDPAQMGLAFDVNVLGPVRVLKAVYPLLLKGDDPKVVMISSVVGSMGLTRGGRGIPYCVSKAALNMLTLLASFHLTEKGVQIAAVHPGWVKTDMGGPEADISIEEAAEALQATIEGLSPSSPVYVDNRGREIPW
jgi:NAD(P)-dependent dehydrogenase (short-subunit alcohol dehydrogenase family)